MGKIERVLIADDEPLARDRLRHLVLQVEPRAQVWEVGDGLAAIESIRANAPQAVLLDIEMPGRNGLEVIDSIGPERMPPTVLVTAYDDHTLAAFDAAALHYLLKPIDARRFQVAWRRIEERIAARGDGPRVESARLIVREGGRSIVVPLEAVRWIESSGNYVIFRMAEGSIRVRETLAAIERRLDPARFVRIHRRFLVAIDSVREVRPCSGGDQLAVLEGGTKLPVSRNYRVQLEGRLGETT